MGISAVQGMASVTLTALSARSSRSTCAPTLPSGCRRSKIKVCGVIYSGHVSLYVYCLVVIEHVQIRRTSRSLVCCHTVCHVQRLSCKGCILPLNRKIEKQITEHGLVRRECPLQIIVIDLAAYREQLVRLCFSITSAITTQIVPAITVLRLACPSTTPPTCPSPLAIHPEQQLPIIRNHLHHISRHDCRRQRPVCRLAG